jgi:ParB family chromosome partitioning protein
MIQFDQTGPREGFFFIETAAIDVGDRLRPTDEAHVLQIASSMSEQGQLTPILVRNGEGNRVILVAGLHRLRAAEALGWPQIKAERINIDAAAARLMEIDENLCRHELTALDRAIFLAERKRVYEDLHPTVRHGGDRRKKVASDQVAMLATWSRFTAEAAEKVGLSERTVRRACELASAITPAMAAHLRASGVADNGAQLKQIADIEDEGERLKVAEALAGGAQNVDAAKVAAGLSMGRERFDPDEKAFLAFLAIWGRASSKARARISEYVRQYDAPGPAARKAAAASQRSAKGPAQ